jgi:hypothetical protein
MPRRERMKVALIVPPVIVGEKCGAKTRKGTPCDHLAGYQTPHPGRGRCKFHGGLTPVKHGRYSSLRLGTLSDLIEEFKKDPEPLNIFPELAAARALFQDFLERYQAWFAAMLAWYASWDATTAPVSQERMLALGRLLDEYEELLAADPTEQQKADLVSVRGLAEKLAQPPSNRPRQILDISDAYKLLAEITKIVEREEKKRAANAVSRQEMMRLLTEMGRIVALHVHDEAIMERIERDWVSLVRVA